MGKVGKDYFLSFFSAEGADREKAVREINEAVRRVNDAVMHAVDIGLSVEMVRVSRCHDGNGNWGDQLNLSIQESQMNNAGNVDANFTQTKQ
jgi:hypothetical protein